MLDGTPTQTTEERLARGRPLRILPIAGLLALGLALALALAVAAWRDDGPSGGASGDGPLLELSPA
jgi:hypothetical protein